jgi:hypothetical protein
VTAAAQPNRRTLDEILATHSIQRLHVDAAGVGYTTCPECSPKRKPANRQKPVLHVTIDRDGVRWFCNHCGWKGGEFFEPRIGRRSAAKYDYKDETGALLFQTVRLFPKDFRQRRPDGAGGWVWKLDDTRRVLYGLPELLAAKRSGRKLVFIVEGEKDVDALRKRGEVATTNPMGAGKWRDEYSEMLRGFDTAVIVADKDDEGRAHAQQVAASVAQIVKQVRIIELPGDGIKDTSNFLAADGTVDDIYAVFKAAPDWGPTAQGCEHATDSTFPEIAEAAYYGLAGLIVRTVEPHTESDPIAILTQVLTYFGNVIGRSAYYAVESDRHCGNLFIVLVGDTAKPRKGTSGGRVRAFFENVETGWLSRIKSGLSSGEGVINECRDQVKKWNAKDAAFEVIDPGVGDKRFLVVESEFANALSVMERAGNALSPVLRNAWDGRTLETLTKNSPLKATGSHISIVAHITEDELRANITRTDAANGFGNRFLFLSVRRSKLLPFGGNLEINETHALAEQIKAAVEFSKTVGRVDMTAAARDAWNSIYSELSAGQPGLLGAITPRAEAQVVRLALIFALLDRCTRIDTNHLKAAIAVWEYAAASTARIFGDSLGDPVADEILRALQQAGATGMTRTEIMNLFGRHKSVDRIGIALALLAVKARARMESRRTGGRPVETWFSIRKGG